MPRIEAEWVPLPAEESHGPRSVEIGGVHTDVFTSPLDTPLAYRVFLDDKRDHVVIRFRYALDEAAETAIPAGGIKLFVGKNSGRLMGIQAPVSPGEATDGVAERIVHGLEALRDSSASKARRRGRYVPLENLRIAKDFFSANPQAVAHAFG